jgi:hypothetical protein
MQMSNVNEPMLRIERLHELAALGQVELEALYSDDMKSWLIEFVDMELSGAQPPLNSPKEFADALRELGRNKQAWSQRLGSLVIDLHDSQTPEHEEQASTRLREFAQQCPWKFLRESASRKL